MTKNLVENKKEISNSLNYLFEAFAATQKIVVGLMRLEAVVCLPLNQAKTAIQYISSFRA